MRAPLADPIGNLEDFPLLGRGLERIAVASDDCAKRVLRFETSVGPIGLRFDGARRLRDGDVVHADAELVIAVAVEADDVLIGRPPTIAAALALAHALGNRHLPVQVDGDAIVVRFDPLLAALFAEHGVPVTREALVRTSPFRHTHAPHGHD